VKSTRFRRLRGLFRIRGVRVGCGLALLFSVVLGVRAFPGWWQNRLVTKAGEYLAHGDTCGAFLSAHEALNRDDAYIPAVELMAQLALRSHSPEEIFWCQRLVTLQPCDASRRVQLAEAALRNEETFIAKHALDRIPEADQSFRYHGAAAALALFTGHLRFVMDHLQEAHRLQPGDMPTKLMLERVRLASPDPEARALAHERLEGFASDFATRLEACRVLLAEARAQGRFDDAKRLSQKLRDLPEAALSDRLAYLEELDRRQEPGPTEDLRSLRFENELDRLEGETVFDGASIFEVGSWLNSHHHADYTLEWLSRLPETQRALPATMLVEAGAMVMSKDWPGLEKRISAAQWGQLEYLRLAFLARADLERRSVRDEVFSATWQKARQSAGTDRDKIKTLASLAESWNWNAESEALWWELANDANASLSALQHLYSVCRKRGATDEMLRISERIYHLDPSDLIARNNVAQLNMLLGRASPETQRIACENAVQHPDDWALNSTYAFSLHLQGRDREAIDHLLGLPGQPQRDPQMAAYFGILYAAAGQPERARPLLELAARADLLPEEARLVRAAFTP
jgi:thioredoxin-like negative regulator of GroEL